MSTIIKNEKVRRALSAFLLLALVLSMFGNVGTNIGMVTTASACQTGKPCEEANGSPTIQEPKDDKVVTVEIDGVQATVVKLTNNGGGTPNLGAGGVQTQAINGTNNSTITLSVSADTPLTLPEGTNATVTYTEVATNTSGLTNTSVANGGLPGGDTNLAGVGNAENSGLHNGSNPHVYTKEELQAFALTVGFNCGENATNANVACWNYWYINNLHKANNGQPVCSSTGNANNPLIKDYGGWLVKLSMIKSRVDEGTYVYGDAYTCGGNNKNNKR